MALGSDEAAVLEIEVDTQGFDEQMSTVEARAERAQKAQTRAVEREQRKQAAAVAAGIVAWKKFFDFLESGSGPAAERFKKIHEEFNSLTSDVAEATAASGPMSSLASLLESITAGASSGASGIRMLGEAIGALAAPPLAAITGMERFARAVMDAAGIQTDFTPQRGAGGPARGLRNDAAASLGPNPELQVMPELVITPRSRGGGGGASGMTREEKMALIEEQARRAKDAELAMREVDAARFDDIMARTQANGDLFAEIQEEMNTKLFDASGERRQVMESEAKAFFDMEEAKRQAIEGTTQALIQSTIATIAHGAAEGASAKQIANRVAVASAWHALEEAAAGVAALAVTWGVPNPSATGHFLSAAMYGALAVGAGAVGAALPGGGRGRGAGAGMGGGGFAAPRGGGGAAGGGNMNLTVNVSAVDLGDRGTQRRLGESVSRAWAAGFVNVPAGAR